MSNPFFESNILSTDLLFVESEYLVFERVEKPSNHNSKTDKFIVLARRDKFPLGLIYWHGSWRQYCFFPHSDTVFSSGCLDDISAFVLKVNKHHVLKKLLVK